MNQILSITQQKFFLYARKSTDVEDKQVHSIQDQLAELRSFAARENISILEELTEKQSAKVPGRPVFDSMIERIEAGEASGIISWHPDRLARNSMDGGKIIYLLDRGVLSSLKFPQHWFENTPQGKFSLNMAFCQSKYFVDSLSENTKRGLRQKVKRGEMPGLAPVGYLNHIDNSRRKSIIVDKKRSPIVIQAFELFATGDYRLMDIRDFLARNGIVTRTGKPHQTDWLTRLVLSNPFYYGHFKFLSEVHEGVHEPIITKKLFDQVQEVLQRRSRKWSKPEDDSIPKPFLGLFRCGECGMMITGERKEKFYKQTNHRAVYTYYRCTKKSKNQKCSQPFTREEVLDSQLSSLLQKVSLRPDWAGNMQTKLEEEKTEVAQSGFAFAHTKKKEIELVSQKLQFLLDSYLDQTIERNDYLERKSKLMGEKKTLEEQITRTEQKQNAWLGPLENWINEAAGAARIASGNDLNKKKVLALKVYGSNLTLKNKTARGEGVNAWAAFQAAPPTRGWERDKGIEPSSHPWEGCILPVY